MTNDQYRALPAYSNSDLTAFMDWQYNRRRFLPESAFHFGTAVHEVVLEPHIIESLPADVDLQAVQNAANAARNQPLVQWALQWAQKEKIHRFVCPVTGLPLKAKLDLVWKSHTVIDLKTTSATTEAEFRRHWIEYGYDRQAAFYLDAIGAKRFTFVAIQKKDFRAFAVQVDNNTLNEGRRKYRQILQQIKQTQWKPKNWTRQSALPLR